MRKFVLAAVLSFAVQPVHAGPRDEQIALSFMNMMGMIIQSARAPDLVQYRPYGPSYYGGPPMRYYPEPQQNSYENWQRRNMIPQYGQPFPGQGYDDDDGYLPPPSVQRAPVPEAPAPSVAPSTGPQTAFGPIAVEWSACLERSVKEDTTNNPDAVLARCAQYTPVGIAALQRDGYTRPQANDYVANLITKARKIAVADLERRQQVRR